MKIRGMILVLGVGTVLGSFSGFAMPNGENNAVSLDELKRFKTQLYIVNHPHAHDGEMPKMAEKAVRLFKQKYDIDFTTFECAKQGVLKAAREVDLGQRKMSDGSAFLPLEIGARKDLNTYFKLLTVRFQEGYWIGPNKSTKSLLQAAYAAATFAPEGLGGLVVALGLQQGGKSTPSAVYNDLYSYVVEFLEESQPNAAPAPAMTAEDAEFEQALKLSMQAEQEAQLEAKQFQEALRLSQKQAQEDADLKIAQEMAQQEEEKVRQEDADLKIAQEMAKEGEEQPQTVFELPRVIFEAPSEEELLSYLQTGKQTLTWAQVPGKTSFRLVSSVPADEPGIVFETPLHGFTSGEGPEKLSWEDFFPKTN